MNYQVKRTSVTTFLHMSLPALYCVGYTALTGNSPVSRIIIACLYYECCKLLVPHKYTFNSMIICDHVVMEYSTTL